MTEADIIAGSKQKGLQDGSAAAEYRPLLAPGISEDADDAYHTAYWHALAYLRNPLL